MALFKISRGVAANLPEEMHDGYCWFTTDDSSFYIDFTDESGVIQRRKLNARDAETLTGASLATILQSSDIEIPTSKAVMDAFASYSPTFTATYDSTTHRDILNAHTAGMNVVCVKDNFQYSLIACTDSTAIFSYSYGNTINYLREANDVWTYTTTTLQSKLTFDETPTADSGNVVSSGGIFDAINSIGSVVEQNNGLAQKFWRGTKDEFDAIETKAEDTMYIITDNEGNAFDITATEVPYDNAASGLVSDDVQSAIDEVAGKVVQSDWNQNDETAPDYVKNRTHWEEDPVIVDNEITLEETTYEEFYDGYCRVDATINFVEGANCVVTWDGIEYESVCGRAYDDTNEYYMLGNPMLLGFDEDPEDNGQPFGIVYNQYSKYLCFVSSDVEAFSHTVKITSNYTIQEFHKLDNKYIDAEWMAESPIYDRVLDIEETVLTGEPYDGVFIAFLWLDNFKPLSVMEKATFNIILDGVEYTSVSEYGEFGNLDLRYGNLNGGDPYYGVIQKEGIVFTFPSEGDHTISLTADNFIYKQLPKEYLPTSVQGAVSYSEYQSLPEWAKNIARENIRAGQSGKIVTGNGYVISDETFIAKPYAEVFNDYNNNIAVGTASHAEGSNTIALGDYSHAEGGYTFALGDHSHAEGGYTFALGDHSHAEGGDGRTRLKITGDANATTYTLNTTISNIKIGNVIVYNNKPVKITAYDSSTLTITVDTTLSATEALRAVRCWMYYGPVASGKSSHAEGNCTTASGDCSHAEGNYTIASGENQHAEGKYNIKDSTNIYAHIVGNGTSYTERSNAHTLDWNGNAWFAGDVYVGSTSGTNKDEGSVKLQKSIAGIVGQVVGFDDNGNAVAQDKPTYTAEEVGALPTSGGTITGELYIDSGITLSNTGLGGAPYRIFADNPQYVSSYSENGASMMPMYTQANTKSLRVNGVVYADGLVAMNKKISGVGDPSQGCDATNKMYVDKAVSAKADKPSMTRITLSPTSWDATALTQSVAVTGISADETTQIIQCSPYGASMSAAVENGIYCSGQAADTLTFTCTSVPTEKVQFVVSWQDCAWIEPPAELINFTIKYITDETIEYQAEEGMTWKEWIYSDYNTFGVTTEGSTEDGYYTDEYDGVYGVVGGLEVYVACDEIEYMDANTVITSGTKYYNMVGY